MSLIRRRGKNKEYLYFYMGKRGKLYLGTSDNPRAERVMMAIEYLNELIKDYQAQKDMLENLLNEERIEAAINECKTRLDEYKTLLAKIQSYKQKKGS
jgi:hypothetical protein